MKQSPKLPALRGLCRPGQFVADAQAHAAEALNPTIKKASRSADGLLYALVGLLLLVVLTHCSPARQAAEQHHRTEQAAPAHGRYDWYWVDTDE